MKEIDMNKLGVAIEYIRRMSEGNNPVNNQPAEDTVLDNVNVVRCLYFVADVLEQVRDNGGITNGKREKTKKKKREKFSFDILNKFSYRNDKPISHLVRQINEPVDVNVMQKISYSKIIKALKEEEYLIEKYDEESGKDITVPTQKGKEVGIYCERRESSSGNVYHVVMYSEKAQNFLIENLEQLLMNE